MTSYDSVSRWSATETASVRPSASDAMSRPPKMPSRLPTAELAVTFTAAAPPAATVATTRVAFTKCLRDDMKKALEAKVEDVQYEMQVKSNCGPERDAFRKAVIALGRASGDSEAVATEDADRLQAAENGPGRSAVRCPW